MGVLDEILSQKRSELPELRRRKLPPFPKRVVPIDLRRKPDGTLRILAENKRRSPSAGALSTVLGVTERAAAYERAGASLISVLCDNHFFGGDYEDLHSSSRGVDVASALQGIHYRRGSNWTAPWRTERPLPC
ncbi:MAG: hypothetical protein QM784_15265 [Polyangiaceae bacterium]